MIDPNCCLDEDEFEEKIRVSRDARMRMMDKPKPTEDKDTRDPIADADAKGKANYLETDEMFLRASRMDVKTVFYLEDRMKSCYRLREDVESHGALLNCFKDATLRQPVECECDVRNYLREINNEKHEFSEKVSKIPKKKEKSGKDDKAKGKDGKAKDKDDKPKK